MIFLGLGQRTTAAKKNCVLHDQMIASYRIFKKQIIKKRERVTDFKIPIPVSVNK